MLKYKPDTAAILASRFLEPGEAVLEIGAADGEHTRLYADRVGPSGSVLAVEPHTGSLHTLAQTMAAQPWVTVHPAAVGAEGGTAAFYPDRRAPKMSSLYGTNVNRPGKPYLVSVTTVDVLVAGMPQVPALIHVDAQGAEAEILRGATRTLLLPIVWIVEVWPSGLQRAGATAADVLRPFRSMGYRAETTHGAVLSWPDVDRACEMRRPDKYQHVDLVLVPDAEAAAW